jgi:hypothetical protein
MNLPNEHKTYPACEGPYSRDPLVEDGLKTLFGHRLLSVPGTASPSTVRCGPGPYPVLLADYPERVVPFRARR